MQAHDMSADERRGPVNTARSHRPAAMASVSEDSYSSAQPEEDPAAARPLSAAETRAAPNAMVVAARALSSSQADPVTGPSQVSRLMKICFPCQCLQCKPFL